MKKLLALVLALVMTLSLAVVGSNAAFKDADKVNETYAEAVDVLAGMKVFQGYTDGSFQPKGAITRAEVAAIVYRLYTGDVKDAQASLYATYNKFSDMDGAKWAAGYIGYCANAGLVKGYDAKTFGPADKVTGYQALAMILRAVGYDKNNEFTGADWQLHVAQYAQQLGVLKNVKNEDLNAPASRELVAELLFRTAAEVPMVTYTPALGYTNLNAIVNGTKNATLGYKNFGLAEYKGYVVANEATGEDYTVVAADRKGTTSFNLAHKTDLDMIGHKVSGWYDATSAKTDKYSVKYSATVYNMKDLSTAETVLTAKDMLTKISKTTVYSDNYSYFTKAAYTPLASKYIVIDKGEAVISLVQGVAKVYAIDNYATTKTMTLTADNGATRKIYKQSDLTGIDGLAVNDYVVTTVIGDITNLAKLEKTVTGTYSYRDAQDTITLTDGTKLTKSPLFTAAGVAGMSPKNDAPTISGLLSLAKSLVFVLDEDGRYVSYQEVSNGYLFGTYAYYVIDNAATAQVSYYVTGVTIDGQVVTKKINGDKTFGYNSDVIQGNSSVSPVIPGIANLNTNSQLINNSTLKGADLMVTETSTADIFRVEANAPASTGVAPITDGTTITKTSAVLSGSSYVNYFVDENTTFYFVTGSVAAPEVQTVSGKEALLAGGDNYVLNDAVMSTSVLNYTYGNNTTGTVANYHVDKVLVKGPYSANAAKNLYYVTDGALISTGLSDVNTIKEVYQNDKIVPVWTNAASALTANKFYFHNTVSSTYNNTVEALTVLAAGNNNGVYAWYDAQTAAVGSWDLYLRTSGTQPVKVSNDATVVDLRPAEVATADYANGFVGTNRLPAISTFADLVKIASHYNIKVDAAGTASGATVVYIKSVQQINTDAQYTVTWSDASVCEVVSGYLGGTGTKVPFNGAVQFYLKGAAASSAAGAIQGTAAEGVTVSYKMNGVEKTITPMLTVINGKQTYVYTVSDITADVEIKVNSTPAAAAITLEKITHDGNKFTVDTKLATAIASGSMTKFVATVKTAAGVTVATKTQDFTAGWALTDHFTVDYATAVAHNQDFKVQLTIYNDKTIVAQSAETVLHLA